MIGRIRDNCIDDHPLGDEPGDHLQHVAVFNADHVPITPRWRSMSIYANRLSNPQ